VQEYYYDDKLKYVLYELVTMYLYVYVSNLVHGHISFRLMSYDYRLTIKYDKSLTFKVKL